MDKEAELQNFLQQGMTVEDIQRWYNTHDDDSGLLALADMKAWPIVEGRNYGN